MVLVLLFSLGFDDADAVLVPGPAKIGLDGGYRDILIRLNKDVCTEKDCSSRIGKLKVISGCPLPLSASRQLIVIFG